jgi:hypothetical protein
MYTSIEAAQIYRWRSLITLPWSDALADSGPLRERITSDVTEELLERIAREHRKGRRLYVGTTNLDTQKLVVWDLGAIAAGKNPHRLQLFRDVLLASCSVPGLMPPVSINVDVDGKHYAELHSDGSVNASLFLLPQMIGIGAPTPAQTKASDTTVYILVAGKLEPEQIPVDRRLLQVSKASLNGMLQAQMENDMQRVYMLTRIAGAQFRLAAVPQSTATDPNPLSFDSKSMLALFNEGLRVGRANGPWKSIPPGIAGVEWDSPRGDVRFVTGDSSGFRNSTRDGIPQQRDDTQSLNDAFSPRPTR